MMTDYWIPISIASDLDREAVEQTLKDCTKTRKWTLQVLAEQWKKTERVPDHQTLKLNLTLFRYLHLQEWPTRRFTLDHIAMKTADEFRIDKEITSTREESVKEFEIEAREIWRKYLELYGGISTVYGMLMLEGEWQKTLVHQAWDNELDPNKFSEMWKSVTLRQEGEGYQIRFNLKKKR